MTTPIFSTSLVRELRGSPLTVLVALLLLEQSGQIPVTAQLLKDVTGYSDNTVTDSLHALTSPTRQIVVRMAGGWRLAQGFQFPLEIENRNISDFESVNAVNVVIEESDRLLEDNNNSRGENRNISDSHIRNLLHEVGIQEPMAGRLAKLHWMTREYISAHAEQIKRETWDHPQGMLIHRLQNQYPAPEFKPDHKQEAILIAASATSHPAGCDCMDCTMVRLGGRNMLCPTCHHYHCECKE